MTRLQLAMRALREIGTEPCGLNCVEVGIACPRHLARAALAAIEQAPGLADDDDILMKAAGALSAQTECVACGRNDQDTCSRCKTEARAVLVSVDTYQRDDRLECDE